MEVKRQNLATQGGPASAVAAAVSAAVLLGCFAGVIFTEHALLYEGGWLMIDPLAYRTYLL